MDNNLPQAVCVVIFNQDGDILGASVRGEPTVFGLPGGKVDPGEKPIDAAIREVYEETGLVMHRALLIQLHEGDDDHGYYVTTYRYVHTIHPAVVIQPEPDINVQWVTPAELINGRCGSYNDKVMTALLKRAYAIVH
jgi:8-oxo-dGTP pyrophosphatase MutT (NUDIX family)